MGYLISLLTFACVCKGLVFFLAKTQGRKEGQGVVVCGLKLRSRAFAMRVSL